MNEWMVSTEALERVHGGVMGRIRRRRMVRRSAGVATILAVLTFAFWPVPAELETLALKPPPPPVAPTWVKPATPPKGPILMAKAISRPAERITIYTDDPDVVIVLVADGGEE